MDQMEPQGPHRQNIQRAVDRMGQGVKNNAVKTVTLSIRQDTGRAVMIDKGKIQQMRDHKKKNDGPGQGHQPRGQGAGFRRSKNLITDGPSLDVLKNNQHGKQDMGQKNNSQHGLNEEKPRPQAGQFLGITVVKRRPQIDKAIPRQVPHQKEDEHQPGDGNDLFLTNRGF